MWIFFLPLSESGAAVKMEHFQAALDPRKQELLEARFLGARVSYLSLFRFWHFFARRLNLKFSKEIQY